MQIHCKLNVMLEGKFNTINASNISGLYLTDQALLSDWFIETAVCSLEYVYGFVLALNLAYIPTSNYRKLRLNP